MKSNCLFEAVKAKLKDPKNIRIIWLRKKWNGVHHFMWTDGKTVWHYENKHHHDDGRTNIYFEGRFKKMSFDTFEATMLKRNYFHDYLLDMAKKLKFKSLDKPGYRNWAIYCPDADCFDLPKKNKICKYVMIMEDSSISIKEIKDVKLEADKATHWKYVSPYCQEYYFKYHD